MNIDEPLSKAPQTVGVTSPDPDSIASQPLQFNLSNSTRRCTRLPLLPRPQVHRIAPAIPELNFIEVYHPTVNVELLVLPA